MNDMNEYDNRDRNERYYDNRDFMYRSYDYRDEDYRDYRNYRDDYRRRDYDRRGGRINNRDYRNYRNYRDDYHEELEMTAEDMRDTSRRLEDIADMSKNPNEKNTLTRVAQKEKEHYNIIKQMIDKGM